MSKEIHAWFQEFSGKIKREGMLEGKREGMLEGKREGEQRVLRRQLQLRFGKLSLATKKRIDQASLDEMEAWAERILTAKTLEEVFGSS